MTYEMGYRNGWIDAGLGITSTYALRSGGDYSRGYREGRADRVAGRDPKIIAFFNHIIQGS